MNRIEDWMKRLCAEGTLRLWLLAAMPLWAVLTFTGCVDPSPDLQPGTSLVLAYLPVSAMLVLFSMALNLVKGFFVLYFGKVDSGMLNSGRKLARIHGMMLLLEAAATIALFLLRKTAAYPVLEQIQLFGHELIYALMLMAYLRMESEASLKRVIVVGVGCFLASSAWLLLSVITAVI